MSGTKQCDVLLFGDYFCDLIITGLDEIPRLGAETFGKDLEVAPGGAFILAAALQRLGIDVRWAARLGNDLFSRFMAAEVAREGLDTSLIKEYDRPLRSVSLSFSFSHDRGFISFSDPLPEAMPYKELIERLQPRWVYNLPFDGAPGTLDLVDLVHRHGGRVYSDCQYTTSTLPEPSLEQLLRRIDIFAPNQSEACQLTGMTTVEEAAARLAQFCAMVIIKCGPDGAYAQSGPSVWHSPAIDVAVVDTTGAGDSFNAGFLAAEIQGLPFETCLQYGNICGGLSTTRRGGTQAVPTLDQLKRFLQE